MPIKVVTFDFWGTLYRNTVSLKHERKDRIRAAFDRCGITHISDEQIYKAMENSWLLWDDIWRKEQRTLPVAEFLGLVFGELKIQLPGWVIDELCHSLQEAVFTGNTVPTDHIVEVVAELSRSYKLGIISDTGVSSGKYLGRLIERDHPGKFSFGLYSDELGMSKPAAGVFQKVLDINGCKADEVVHVGDLKHTDVLGAKQAGMYSVRYSGVRDDIGEGFPEADWVITDYRDLTEIIRGIR